MSRCCGALGQSLDNQNVPQENTHPNFGHPSDGHPSDGHDFEAQGARVGILDGPKNSDPPSVKDGWSFDQVFSERVGVYFTNVFRVWVCLSYQPTQLITLGIMQCMYLFFPNKSLDLKLFAKSKKVETLLREKS